MAKAMGEGKLGNSEIAQANAYLDVCKNFTIPLLEAFEARPSAEDSRFVELIPRNISSL
jgi:hypothetical protein